MARVFSSNLIDGKKYWVFYFNCSYGSSFSVRTYREVTEVTAADVSKGYPKLIDIAGNNIHSIYYGNEYIYESREEAVEELNLQVNTMLARLEHFYTNKKNQLNRYKAKPDIFPKNK